MSVHSGDGAEPNLTPMLDMVFQLVTFFMLVIQFQSASIDMSLKLPIVGSARPVDTKGQEELLMLNINTSGDILIYGTKRELESYIGREAEIKRRQLAAAGTKLNPGEELPTMVVIRADAGTPFHLLNRVITECQKNGFRKFALKAMSKEQGS
jgi:biopolymer transport protein ExbD